uniref:Uncharacterized protein n=1 Tax=Tanacetum cinerariifolium TaxID=118510 RepID=A0A6L2N3D3_TANCI|nr:hypothetical protein [Tanacetum cinerariifolium]
MTGDDNHDGDQPETLNPTQPIPPPTSQLPHTVSSIKLSILKRGNMISGVKPQLSLFMNKKCDLENTPVNDRYAEGIYPVPPPITGNYMPSRPDVKIDYSKFTYSPKQTPVDESDSKPVEYASSYSDSSVEKTTSMSALVDNAPKIVCEPNVWTDAPIIEEYESDSDDDSVSHVQENIEKASFAFTDSVKHVKSRNKAHLADYQEFKGGSVAFGGSNGRITGKGKINTGRLYFKDVYYVEELKHYNIFSVSQMYDKKNKVLFTDTDYLVLSYYFKLPDENQVLLKIPRQHNMYSFNLKNIDPSGDLSCLLTKASIDESNKWHRRLGHVNFKNLNKLVKGNLVRGLPSKIFENDHTCVAFQKGKQHKASCKAKIVSSMNQPLQILRMDLFGPTSGSRGNIVMPELHNKMELPRERKGTLLRSAYLTNVKSLEDKIQKTTDCKTCEKPVSQVEKIFQEELEKLKRQEKEANDALRKEATHDYLDANTNSTNLLNGASAPVSAACPSKALNDVEPSYPDDPSMPYLKDIFASPSEGIFTNSSYDNEGMVTDFNNLETTVNVSPTSTTGIHTIHPKTQILRDPMLAVQIRSKMKKNSKAHALDKKDENGVVTRNKARLVAQGHRQEERIDYDEVFAHVARIEAIRIFLAFASYIGFIVYQMDVKSAFLYGIINEEVYVDDIIFGSTKKSRCDEFEELMKNRFQMSSMGELTFFLGLQKPLVKDEEAADVDVHLYRSMIGSLMYLTASRPDIMFAVCVCSRFQVTSKTSHLQAVKRIFSDYAGVNLNMKSTTGEAEYVVAAHCCVQVLWIQNQLLDYGFNLMNTKIYIDNESTICIVKNPVFHSKTKHIEIRHHFIRDAYEKKLIQVLKIHIDDNVVDLLTKAFDELTHLDVMRTVLNLGIDGFLCTIYVEKDGVEVTAAKPIIMTTPTFTKTYNLIAYFAKPAESEGFEQIIDFLYGSSVRYVLTTSPTIHTYCIKQFWLTAKVKTINDEVRVQALIDAKRVIIKESSIRRTLKLDDEKGKAYNFDLQHSKKVLSMQDIDEEEPAKVEKVLEVVTTAKLIIKVVTTTEPTTTAAQAPKASAPRRRRGVVIKDPKEIASSVIVHIEVQSKDKGKGILIEEPKPLKGQAQIKADKAFARQYQALKRKPLTEAQAMKNMIIYHKNMVGFKMNFFKGMTYNKIRPLFEKHYNSTHAFLERVEKDVTVQVKEIEEEGNKRQGESMEQEIAKKQRMDEEEEELKRHLQIMVNDDDDVYTEATPLASKKLIKERFETTEPKNFLDDFLLNILKIMFEKPNIEASVWKDQKGRYGLAKKYPLTHFTLEKILNNVRLEVKEESEMCLELIRPAKDVTTTQIEVCSISKTYSFTYLVYINELSLKFIDAIVVRPIGGDRSLSPLQLGRCGDGVGDVEMMMGVVRVGLVVVAVVRRLWWQPWRGVAVAVKGGKRGEDGVDRLEEQTDGEAVINSIKNGDQTLPCVTQVSIVRTSSTEQPPLKDKSMWSDQEKKIQKIDRLARSLLIQCLLNDIYSLIDSNKTAKDLWDALARHMLGSEYGEQDRKVVVLYEYETFKAIEGELLLDTYIRYLQVINDLRKYGYSKDNCELNFKFLINLQPKWKQYATMMRQNKNLMYINIDALYNILKQNQGDVNDVMGLKKKTVVVTSDPLALIAEKTKVSKRKEKVVVSSDSERSDDELKKITALLEKAFNRKKFYSKPTNNNLRTSSTSNSANKKQEFVKSDDKKEDKKVEEKKRDMSKFKCYSYKKECHFAKECKKAKVKDYEYYKTKMLLAKKDKDEQVLLAKDHAWM